MVERIDIKEEKRDKRTGLLKDQDLTSRVIETFNESLVRFDAGATDKIPYSVILFDVDYFKAVNDLLGYDYGNSVLSGLGKILLSYESKEDFIGVLGRWGGEEFLIALPYTHRKKAKYIADEIKELVEKFSFEDPRTQEKSLQNFITVSLGVSSIDLQDILTEIKDETEKKREKIIKEIFDNVLVRKANCALEYAKFLGRNRVEVFSRYLQTELDNLQTLRKFYFKYSYMKPKELKEILDDPYLQRNKTIKNRIKKHFNIIRTEIYDRDTRTKALFADNLYRIVSKEGVSQKKYFLKFIKKFV